MLRSCALASVVASGLVGCALDFDAIGFTGGGGEGASRTGSVVTGSTATGPGVCEEAGQCLPPAPAGWVGPGALVEESMCPSGQVPLFEGGDDATAGACKCSPVGSTCTNTFLNLFYDDDCMSPAVSLTVPAQDVCYPISPLADPPLGGQLQTPPGANPGICQLESGFVPQISYSGLASICGFEPIPSGCGKDATCVPPGTACIAAPDPSGVAQCPDDYPTPRTQKSKITATCQPCPLPPDLDCDGRVEVHDDAMCQGTSLGSVAVDSELPVCHGLVGETGTVYLKHVLDTQPSCAPADPALAYDPWTVCCR